LVAPPSSRHATAAVRPRGPRPPPRHGHRPPQSRRRPPPYPPLRLPWLPPALRSFAVGCTNSLTSRVFFFASTLVISAVVTSSARSVSFPLSLSWSLFDWAAAVATMNRHAHRNAKIFLIPDTPNRTNLI